jgi:hypothetical protein
MGTGSREEQASKQESRASVLIQSEPEMLWDRNDEAIQDRLRGSGLFRSARNDGKDVRSHYRGGLDKRPCRGSENAN